MKISISKAHIAEFFGTLALSLAVLVSLSMDGAVATPIVAGLTLGLFVYTIGSVSGCHINPAVTIALLSIQKVTNSNALYYIIAQVLGAGVAMIIASSLHLDIPGFVFDADFSMSVAIAEAIGTLFFVFGITAVVHNKVSQSLSGVVIGASLLFGVLIASAASNGVLNPAVAFGIGSLSPMYIVGPIAGGIIGAWIGRYMFTA